MPYRLSTPVRRLLRCGPSLLLALALAAPAAADLDCTSLGQLSREFLRHHVSQRALGAEIEERAIGRASCRERV